MALPLLQSTLPLMLSKAYMTAGTERPVGFKSDSGAELEAVKMTPLTTIGADGELISLDVQTGTKDKAPFCSWTCQAAIAPLATFSLLEFPSVDAAFPTGARIQRRPPGSCQLASAPGTNLAPLASGAALLRGVW